MVPGVFLISPSIAADLVGTAAWYITFISAGAAALAFTFIYLLLKRFPGKNIMEVFDAVLGRFIGSILSFVLFAGLIATLCINLREFAELQKSNIFIKTPMSVLIGCCVFVLAVLSFFGLESIARYSKLISFLVVVFIILILILSSRNYQFHRLFPIFGNGLDKTVINGFAHCSIYGAVIIIAVFAKSLQGTQIIKKVGYKSILITLLINSACFLAFTLTFSYYVFKEVSVPMYIMTSLINLGIFFERVESLFIMVWSLSFLVAVAALFYASMMAYCHIFRIADKKPVILPLSITAFALSLIPQRMTVFIDYYIYCQMQFGWIVYFALPLIVFIIAVIRGRKQSAEDTGD